ncbi:hypothetical protein ABT354_10695 [Streptomyces sp. NPDC000594]|uniref:hypothetical protein n=1 Tax=Streptomyces sp. NPDC000594 TaxID=3154261 RepID=UPI0033275F25
MPDCPHLGWDPAPGSPQAVAALHTRLRTAAEALGSAHALVARLAGDSTAWRGEAATAFRAALDGELSGALRDAHRSLAEAARRLGHWYDELLSLQRTALRYDAEAAAARTLLTRAESHHHRLTTTPDTPAPALHQAAATVTDAREALSSVLTRARELESEHGAEARRVARCLDEATVGLAPEEPGVLKRALQQINDGLGDSLSLLSASLGLVSLFVAAPVAVPLMLVAGGLSLAALTSHASDPEHRAAIRDGITQGRYDSRFWSSTITLGGDALGALPGVGAVAQGAKSMVNTVRTASTGEVGLRSGISALATESADTMARMNDAPKPVLDWVVRKTSPHVETPLQWGVAGSAVATATTGLATEESKPVKETATAVDGARLATSDAPSAGVNAALLWAQLTR